MPSSMGSFVDLNLDGSPMKNGTDQMVAPTAPAQKYVTFDEDEPSTRTYDNTQPFTAPTVPSYGNPSGNYGNAPTYGDAPSGNYGNTTEDGYMPSGGGGGMVTENTGQPCLSMEQPKLEQIKKWTVQNYKFTKQLVSEKFGHSTKTVDKDLEDRIEELRLSKVQYGNMLREARVMFARFEALLTTHHNIRAQFQTLISHAPDLQDQLQASATTHSILEKNGEGLLGAIKTFVDSLNTLVNVTIQDTFLTIKNYENSRIEYDAYRNDIVTLQNAPQTEANKNRLLELQVIFENRKQKWEKLKRDTNTKLDLLGENRSMVMKTQLEMFNSAVIAYFSGNGDKLSEVLAEYHIKTKKSSEDGDATTNSFLARNE
ncbi:arfaptin-2-like isoform X1 [Bolinopsis microptera]|uniref:arfaptin-2-like isoform X1 n=1 Tax=Bolinopsis microptera TaxID=2820187 RepID=UPI003078B903